MRPAVTATVACLAIASFAAAAAEPASPPAAASPAAASPAKPVIACKGSERNLKQYLQMHDVLFMQRDGSRVDEFYAPELISHDFDSGGGHAITVKNSALVGMWAASKKNDPGRVLADNLIICQGQFVIVRTTVHGTDNAGYEGNPPTGKSYSISATDIYRFENGKVVERWGNSDLVSMYKQIGYKLVPPAAAAK